MSLDVLPYSVVRYQPDLLRQEVVNVGVVLFSTSGPVTALSPGQGKLLALDPNFPVSRVFEQGRKLQTALEALWREGASVAKMHHVLAEGGALTLSPLGTLEPANQSPEALLDELLHDLVAPPTKARFRQAKSNRLHTELRQVFRQSRILGSKPDDISRHLVVPNFPIDADTGLFAEFALRNGKLHVTETVDFRTSTASNRRQEAQAKTLILVEALERVGSTDLRRYVVVSGATAQVQSSINLLARYSDDLIVRESHQDWQRYVDAIHQAARPSSPALGDA